MTRGENTVRENTGVTPGKENPARGIDPGRGVTLERGREPYAKFALKNAIVRSQASLAASLL